MHELNWPPTARVSCSSSHFSIMLGKSSLEIVGDTGIKCAVAALHNVHVVWKRMEEHTRSILQILELVSVVHY